MNEQVMPREKRSNSTLWLLILTFAVPIIGAYVYFFMASDYSLGNHGELIQPVIQIDELSLTDSDGRPLQRDGLIHKWKMFYIAGRDCEANCQQSLYYMRQINTALGKNADRFQHMIVHLDDMSPEFQQLVIKEHDQALHAYADPDNLQITFKDTDPALASGAIYIMDPLGNIMMRFGPDISPKMILKDLNRLLKISRIG